MGRIQTAVLALVQRDRLAPLPSVLPIPKLAQHLVTELTQASGGHITPLISTIHKPWEQMTIVQYLQTLVRAPDTHNIAVLLAALKRQATPMEQDSLRMVIELWAVHILESAPRVGTPLDKIIFAIHNQHYDSGDEEISDGDEEEDA